MTRKINHVNRFFKEMKRLEDSSRGFAFRDERDENDVHVWRSLSHEATPEECFKRPDGLWETYPEWYGNQYRRKFVFVWRIHPNYCYRGKPHFHHGDVMTFKRNSEIEKILYEVDGYEFVWAWNEVRMPTWCVWGMGMGPTCFFMRKDGKVLTEPTTTKKYFREDVEHELKRDEE